MHVPPPAKPAHESREPLLWPLRFEQDGPAVWKAHSALQRVEIRARIAFDGPDGKASLRVGGVNHWPAVGWFLLEWEANGSLSVLWVNEKTPFRLLQTSLAPSAEPRELLLRLFEEPAFHWTLDSDGTVLGEGDYSEPLPFRPYAVMTDELHFETTGSARLERIEARVGARRAPVVALGDSQIHQGRVLEELRERGAPRIINSGRAAGSSEGALGRLESDVLTFSPKHLLLWVGSNDLRRAEAAGKPASDGIAPALANIEKIVSVCQMRGIHCHAVGALPRGETAVLEFNERLKDLAGRLSFDFYNPYEVLLRRGDKMDIRLSDGLHPNAEGAKMLADWFQEQGLIEKLAED
jgi:lysophospholipase L1-like esterase